MINSPSSTKVSIFKTISQLIEQWWNKNSSTNIKRTIDGSLDISWYEWANTLPFPVAEPPSPCRCVPCPNFQQKQSDTEAAEPPWGGAPVSAKPQAPQKARALLAMARVRRGTLHTWHLTRETFRICVFSAGRAPRRASAPSDVLRCFIDSFCGFVLCFVDPV